MMQVRTDKGVLKLGNRPQPMVSVAIAPKARGGHLAVGVVLGLLFGFVLGSAVALSVGNRSISLAQEVWHRLANADDGERVHFELLLQ
jgi:hypothetical protein